MRLIFRCGHEGQFRENQTPICRCGERGIARAFAGPPRIVGCATGPHVETKALEPITVNLAEAGPLTLKAAEPEARHG
jgi:hypothetical protein